MSQSVQLEQSQLSSVFTATPYTHPQSFIDHHTRYERIPLDRLKHHVNPSPYWSRGAIYGCEPAPNLPVWWVCNICYQKVKLYEHNSSNACRHVKRKHTQQHGGNTTSEISSSTAEEPSQTPQPARPPVEAFVFRMNVKLFRYWLMRWIVEDHRPFLLVESEAFRNMLTAVNSAIQPHIPGRNALQRWTDVAMAHAREQIAVKLSTAQSKIHISFDLWNSPAGYSMLGVIAHTVLGDENPEGKHITLALQRVEGGHTSEMVGQALLDVLLEYNIDRKRLGFFVADNASENDGAIKIVCEGLDICPHHRYVRCLCHIINLAAKAFFFGVDVEGFEENIEQADAGGESLTRTQLEAAQRAWRDQGPIGKQHNIIIHIRSSQARRDEFRNIKIGHGRIDSLEVKQDNDTRWNSYLYASQRCIELERRINIYTDRHSEDLGDDRLSAADWTYLKDVCKAIEPFEQITKALQGHAHDGNYGSLWEWLPALEALLKVMEQGLKSERDVGRSQSTIAIAYHNAWLKLTKYYGLSDRDHEVYGAATIMSPCCREDYFNEHWGDQPELAEFRPVLFNTVRKMWIDNYRDDSNIPNNVRKANALDLHLRRGRAVDGDAYSQYAQERPEKQGWMTGNDVFGYWQRCLSPELRSMAFDLISCPATSTGVERLFSSAGLTVTNRRTRLTHGHVQTYELLKSWWREGITLPPEALEQLD